MQSINNSNLKQPLIINSALLSEKKMELKNSDADEKTVPLIAFVNPHSGGKMVLLL